MCPRPAPSGAHRRPVLPPCLPQPAAASSVRLRVPTGPDRTPLLSQVRGRSPRPSSVLHSPFRCAGTTPLRRWLRAARIIARIALCVGHRLDRCLRHWLCCGCSRGACGRFRAHMAGVQAALFGRISLCAPFGIRPIGVNRSVRQGGDPPCGNVFANRRLGDVALRRIASPGHSHSDRSLIYSAT